MRRASRQRLSVFSPFTSQPASAARSPASIRSAASSCMPGITWLAPAAATILQPNCAVRDGFRWDASGNRPRKFAANGHIACDVLWRATLRWFHTGRPSERPLTAVTRVRIPYALPLICRDFLRAAPRSAHRLQPFCNPNARLWMAPSTTGWCSPGLARTSASARPK